MKMFADDLKLYSAIDTQDDSLTLQQSIDKLAQWADDWQLAINISKCSVLHLGSVSYASNSSYKINGVTLSINPTVLDLGVEMESNQSYHNHIVKIVSLANVRVGVLFRGFHTRKPQFLKQAFITYVRPLLEYSSNVWNPHHKKYTDLI
jgi:ribonuclease P/MRP protein subunit RPP40